MPDAPACRGRDGAGCGFGATRQVNYTKKKAGVVTATYYKIPCKRCLQASGKSQTESAATTASLEGGECFGGAANASGRSIISFEENKLVLPSGRIMFANKLQKSGKSLQKRQGANSMGTGTMKVSLGS